MKLQTKYFGVVDYEPEETIHFSAGIPGFPEERQYVLLPFAGGNNTMFCLQSIETPMLAFVLLDPFMLLPDYEPTLQQEELQQLGVEKSEDLFYYVLCAVHTPIPTSTVNLRCPLAINPHTFEGRQVFLENDTYEMRHPLSSFEQNGGAPC